MFGAEKWEEEKDPYHTDVKSYFIFQLTLRSWSNA